MRERVAQLIERVETRYRDHLEALRAKPRVSGFRREPWAPRKRQGPPRPTVPMEDGPGGWGSLED